MTTTPGIVMHEAAKIHGLFQQAYPYIPFEMQQAISAQIMQFKGSLAAFLLNYTPAQLAPEYAKRNETPQKIFSR
jgi:hypothetical protein